MNRKIYFLFALTALTIRASAQQGLSKTQAQPRSLTSYVDPYIGSAAHGHVFVGASVPFGAVQPGPDNFNKGWDWCSGYHYSDSVLKGFSQDHLNGTGIPDLGDISIMPYTGTVRTSVYHHQDEIVRPSYYSVRKSDGVRVELTASERVSLHKYSFPAGAEGHIIIDLQQGNYSKRMKTDKVRGYLEKTGPYTLKGWRNSSGWADDRRIWFAIESSIPLKDLILYDGDDKHEGDALEAKIVKGLISFKTGGKPVLLKVGISPVSSDQALANIHAEIPGWDFNGVVKAGDRKWNKVLSLIEIQTKDETLKRIFYTALYHTMVAPALYNDADKSYRGTDKKVYEKASFDNYTIFSLWDTYRTLNPLMAIIQPKRTGDFINSMLAIYQQQGKLPIWHLQGNETNCMVGYSAVPIIADAYLNGIGGFDPALALEAMKASSVRDDYGMKYIKERGYIPADKEVESVSKAMEYAVSDWCIAQVAKKLHQEEDYKLYSARAKYYQRYFDPTVKFVRGVMSDGSWRTPFNPVTFDYKAYDYTEGTSWQYTWLVPQDVEGLIRLMGSDEIFANKLDSLFTIKEDLGADAPADISGLIGLYAHGNEPNHHIPYLYAFAGRQWKTAERVRQITTEMYTDKPEGLCGNDDCGQMSAWYIMSALGFYPVNPSNGVFVLGSPLVDQAVIHTAGDKRFIIKAIHNNAANKYIQRVTLNGKAYPKAYIRYGDIARGGTLILEMGPSPNKDFGRSPEDRPVTQINDQPTSQAHPPQSPDPGPGKQLPILGMDVRVHAPSISDSAGHNFRFQHTLGIKKISPGLYHVQVGILPEGPLQPGCIDIPLTISVGGAAEMEKAKNAFHWVPNIKKDPDEIIAQHVFRSPSIILTGMKNSIVFIPDLDALKKNQAAPYYLDLNYEKKTIRINYGLSNYRVVRHQYYTKSNALFSLKDKLEIGFYILIPPDPSPVAALKAANHFLWEHFAGEYTKSPLPQVMPYSEYADRGYSMALKNYWVDAGPDKGGITLSTYYDEAGKKYGGRFYKDDLWYHSWFNNIRTAYGLSYWGKQLHRDDWQKKAAACLRLILSSPKDKGWFPTIYVNEKKGWIASGQGGGPGLYHMPDNVWTAYWIMRFNDEQQKMEGAEPFIRDFSQAVLETQNPDGSFPARVKVSTHLADSVMQSSAASSMATWYLEEMLLRNKISGPLAGKYRQSILRSLDFLDRDVLPKQRFEDFELYFSCSPKPMHYFDSSTCLYGQNTLSIQWCAEAYLKAYQLFKEKKYLRQGEYCLNILSLYQQVWNPPFINLYTFGGFGVQNTDAEWNDARQAQFAETFLNFYKVTGNKQYLERAIYACRSSFALMVIPENKLVCPANYQGTEENGESFPGTMAENYGHSGYNTRSYQSGFHWGTGSALTSAAILESSLGDLYTGNGGGPPSVVGADQVLPVDAASPSLVDYVDPFIGTANGGNVFHGATLPFGMVKLGPDCNTNMASAGYDERNNTLINGFSHTHTSGAGGGPKYGNILVQPFTGEPAAKNYGSSFSAELPRAGSYKVHLDKYNIDVALTATHSVGLHSYTFQEAGKAGILIDAGHFLVSRHLTERQELVGSAVKIVSSTEIEGYSRVRGGWGNGGAYTVYFYAVSDTPAGSAGVWKNDSIQKGGTVCEGPQSTGAWLSFMAGKGQCIKLKVGISYISAEKARENISKEMPGWDFEQAVQTARSQWNEKLGAVELECPSDTLRRMFYTALYHSMLMPVNKTGENSRWDSGVPYYDDFYAIWDTYRCMNPLLTLIAPAVQRELVNSLIDIYQHDKYMPDARSGDANGRTQGGSNSDILIADAFVKGLKDIDYETGLKAMIKNAEVPPGDNEQKEGRGGLPDYNSIGYVSTDYERSGTRTMEYAADDYAIALVAKGLNKNELFEKYLARSSNWKNLWRPIADQGANGFIWPRKKNGQWMENFTTLQDGSWRDPFYESHSWELSFYVPQDINGLVQACGGEAAFRSRLDTYFEKGYYNVNNEPGFLTPLLYNWIGRPDLTARRVHAIIRKNYNAGRRGLPGNDDSGAMSSWLVFQLMGFFPVAGQDLYTISSPHFAKAVVHLEGGKSLVITAKHLSDKNIFIQSAKLNGQAIDRSWFRHTEIAGGGSLEFEMGDQPGNWATGVAATGITTTHTTATPDTTLVYHAKGPLVPDKAHMSFSSPFPGDQQISGWLGERMRINKDKRLLQVDEEALLAGYIHRPGNQMWVGEHVGKFLDAACNTYLNTRDAALKMKIDRMARQLIATQLDNGYLGTYLPADYWKSWDVWSHKYNIIGLLNYYSISGYEPALHAAEKAADLLCTTFGTGKGQLDLITAGEHLGMAATSVLEPMVDLYRYTGNKKYFDFCIYITQTYSQSNGPGIISTLNSIGKVNKTANAKAYEMLSNLLGLVKLYKLTGDEQYLRPALQAWKDIVKNRLYITGTTSSGEHFMDDHSLQGDEKDEVGEGCVTTTWIQLNYQLLCISGKMEYLDELERSVYNHLTGAESPQTGCVSYFTPLMGIKPYKCNITCCLSSVPRAIAMIPLFANGKIDHNPSFLFYQPGIYKTTIGAGSVAGKGSQTEVTFNTVTNFPETGKLTIIVDPARAASFTVALRKPSWAADFAISVNGVRQAMAGEQIVLIKRTWVKGDNILVRFNMPVKIWNGGESYPGMIALQRGPQVLAFDSSLNSIDPNDILLSADKTGKISVAAGGASLPAGWIGRQAYQVGAMVKGRPVQLVLVPFADAGQGGARIETWVKGDSIPGAAAYVNPFLGTAKGAYTFPGAVVPWGMVSVSPHNNRKAFSGYNYTESYMYGFGHVHLSGVGCQDLGNIVIMPTTGGPEMDPVKYRSSYDEESARPGYYQVRLKRYGIRAEMSATTHTGISAYRFPVCRGDANIIIDASSRITALNEFAGTVKIISPTKLEGSSMSGDFCSVTPTDKRRTVYFAIEFNKPAVSHGMAEAIACYRFDTRENEILLVRTGVSYVSTANAWLNLQTEQPGWDFEKVKADAYNSWNKELGRIEVKGGTSDDKTTFYTGIYHMLLHPNILNDVNGEYPSMGHKGTVQVKDHDRYTVYSLWDTYRNEHPFLSLVYPARQLDMVRSMIDMYRESGWFPKWELGSNETYVMVGDPAVPVIADTYLKGIRDFDIDKAMEGMLKSATQLENNPLRPGLAPYLKYGYIPMEFDKGFEMWGPVSTSLEYSFADWCLAQLSKELGRTEIYDQMIRRSESYKKLYDPGTGFIRPRNLDGAWHEPFDPVGVDTGPGVPGFVEGNSWQYSFFVPHDIPGLIRLMGSKELFVKKLQECFDKDYYTLSNEPDMAYPFLFNYVPGEEWRTQRSVRTKIVNHYYPGPDGLGGNDDCGVTSALYVFSAMGLYPDCPGSNKYQLTSPLFDEIIIHLDSKFYKGKTFTIRARNNSRENMYIRSMQLNGKGYEKFFISHEDLVQGGELTVELGPLCR